MTTETNELNGQPKPKPELKDLRSLKFAPTHQAWLGRKLSEYTTHIGKSIDAETTFIFKEKEWMAAMKIGRQSARDRLRAGRTLLEIQKKMIDEFGYPFWPYLKAMGVPTKTAQRAIELAKFYVVEGNLGDKTITDCYAEIKAATAKAKVKNDHDDNDDITEDEVEQQEEQEANEDDQENEIAGKIGKGMDSVSKGLPISPMPNSEESAGDEPDDQAQELFGQEELTWEIDGIEDSLQEFLTSMDGDLGPFPEPDKLVKQIEHCIDLCEQLKVKIPVSQ